MISDVVQNRDEQVQNPALASRGSFQLIPLSIQREGDSYLVGNPELNRFYQIPEIGVQVIKLLQEGLTFAEVKARLADGNGDIDVDDFASTLVEIGLAYVGSPRQAADLPMSTPTKWMQAARVVGQIVFSWPAACLCALVVAYAVLCLTRFPQDMPSLSVFYFPGHLTFSLVLLLVVRLFMVLLHELGHMLAAAKLGIDSHLGVGTRLWSIVIEADLTGVLSLPRRKRYLPLLAGMLTDVLSISILFIAITHLLQAHARLFLIQLLQALIMQTFLFMIWQLNVFLRTDLYYVMCTILAYPDLDRDARLYLQKVMHKLSFGRIGMKLEGYQTPGRLNVIRAFSLIWLFGRITSIYMLIAVGVPTLMLYARDDYSALRNASLSALPYDHLLFTLISAAVLGSGLWMWLSRMKSNRLRLLNQQ
jgi:putative peptide zinc metalloprotease protein